MIAIEIMKWAEKEFIPATANSLGIHGLKWRIDNSRECVAAAIVSRWPWIHPLGRRKGPGNIIHYNFHASIKQNKYIRFSGRTEYGPKFGMKTESKGKARPRKKDDRREKIVHSDVCARSGRRTACAGLSRKLIAWISSLGTFRAAGHQNPFLIVDLKPKSYFDFRSFPRFFPSLTNTEKRQTRKFDPMVFVQRRILNRMKST